MSKAKMLLVAIVALSMADFVHAEEKKLGITFDLTYVSKWMSRGREVWSEDGGFFETFDLDLWGTGFGVAVTHRSSTGNGWVNKQRFDYEAYYKNSFLDDSTCKTNYKIKWAYKNYYDEPRNVKNAQAWVFNFSWPDILPVANLSPYYTIYYDYPAGSNYNLPKHWAGWVHLFGLGYNLGITDLPSPLRLTAEVAYTDGFRAADHDWSYATFGLSTKLDVAENTALVPGLYHQVTMDDSVGQRKDITYAKVSLKYKF
ncbi:MAG: hypothetical protein ACYTFK_08565 [Planctomycetota bacterium]|jgi:hypothetical protein